MPRGPASDMHIFMDVHWIYHTFYNYELWLRTDPVVCPNCNIEDVLLSNVIREIEKILGIRNVFCLPFRVFRFLGFRV
jgi:hypothetical protein